MGKIFFCFIIHVSIFAPAQIPDSIAHLFLRQLQAYPYLHVLLKNGKQYYITASLGDFSKKLPPILFQCNRSTIISFNHLAGHDTEGRRMTVTMKDDTVFVVARTRQKKFMERYLHLERLSEPCKFCRNCTEKKFCNQPNPFSLPNGTVQLIGGEF